MAATTLVCVMATNLAVPGYYPVEIVVRRGYPRNPRSGHVLLGGVKAAYPEILVAFSGATVSVRLTLD
jgi:hypothetical protein